MVGETPVTLDNICLSGGADGSDLQWGMMAARLGHKVVHWSFAGHRSAAPSEDLVILSPSMLELADAALKRANRAVGRNWPSKSASTNNLLRRNWYQVKDTGAVYAVGVMGRRRAIEGGTAWAIQMYMDRFLLDGEDRALCQLYFYDQNTNIWWQWNARWDTWEMRVSQPPQPTGIWTGIGTRDLNSDGKWMIRKLMGGFPVGSVQIAAVHTTVVDPQVGNTIYVPSHEDTGEGVQVGGWATVNRVIQGSDELWISVTEYMNTYFPWSQLRDQQEALREEFGLNHALTK